MSAPTFNLPSGIDARFDAATGTLRFDEVPVAQVTTLGALNRIPVNQTDRSALAAKGIAFDPDGRITEA